MFHIVTSYITFLFKSLNNNWKQSSFASKIISECFQDKTLFEDYKKLENFRQQLLQSNTTVSITDFGAGSRKFKSNRRKVSDLAKHVGVSKKNAKLLYRLSKHLKPTNILELGTSLGLGTQALSLGNPKATITTIEGCPNISEFTNNNFKLQHLDNINLITGDFKDIIPSLKGDTSDIIYFDGNHNKNATLQYFEMLLPKVHENSVLIFDDIYWSKGMTDAWKTIQQHPKVTVTIDTFQFGFVFFNKEEKQNHYLKV